MPSTRPPHLCPTLLPLALQAGTDTVSVPTVSIQAPTVFPLATCCKDTITSAVSMTLGCLITSYFPMPVTVTWDAGYLNKSVVTLPATLQTSGLYTTSSHVTVWGKWAKQKFTCSVAHAESTTINKTFSGAPGSGWRKGAGWVGAGAGGT